MTSRVRSLPATLFVVGGLVAPALLGQGVARADDPQTIVVTVPEIAYTPLPDRFRVGQFRTRLHVLRNDSGTPAPSRLQLQDRRGRGTGGGLAVPRFGRLRVVAGHIVFDPAPDAKGRFTFRYRAASPNGPIIGTTVDVDVFDVIVTKNDKATTAPRKAVTVDTRANDRLRVPDATLACQPQLFARPPTRPDPLPLVLPEPAREPFHCNGFTGRQSLSTREGDWLIADSGSVRFTPAKGFTGSARAYYRQATDYPFDVDSASISIPVRRAGAAVLGTKAGSKGDSPDAGSDNGSDGPLASTGMGPAVLRLAVSLVALGLLLVTAARRRRQPADLVA